MNESDFTQLLSDRSRLIIMATLAAQKAPIEFMQLVEVLGMTKGNISSHLKKLEDAKFIVVNKEFVERKPRTSISCSAAGRQAVKTHLLEVERLLKSLK